MTITDLSSWHRLIWMFLVFFMDKKGYTFQWLIQSNLSKDLSGITKSPLEDDIATTVVPIFVQHKMSHNEEVLQEIEQILILINAIKNSSSTISNVKESVGDKNAVKRTGTNMNYTIDTLDDETILKLLRKLSHICRKLNPPEKHNWVSSFNYIPIVTRPHFDRFGCMKLWSSLSAAYSERGTLKEIQILEEKLLDWHVKLDKSQVPFTNPPYPTVSLSESDTQKKHISTYTLNTQTLPTVVLQKPYEVTSHGSILRWNKGLTRYDTSWIKTETKLSDKEIIVYDSFDPSDKEETTKVSIEKSAIRVLPALTVIIFLIFCWYFLVYRRLKQRQQRARALLNQYQAILSGARALSGSVMITRSNSGVHETSVHAFGCSSTYDSCLNERCNPANESRAEQNANSRTNPHQDQQHIVPVSSSRPNTRPRSYPPTYEELFPPAYDSIYGTVV